ncbi:MAG: class I SAM-dependent methyltransferase [Thermoplasmata archaeon]|nr:class I SAM-dependent methyltransferase [Thermoplasmata archaeon]
MWEKAYRRGLRFGGLADVNWFLESLQPEMNVLEIGCGNGKTYLALRKHGIAVLGVDISEEALAILARNAAALGLHAATEIGDARKLRFPDRSFDAVVGIHLLDALETDADREAVISEVSRVLKSNGQFFCEVFCVEDFRNGKGRRICQTTYERGGVLTTYFDEERLMGMLSDRFDVRIQHQRVQRSYGLRCSLRAMCRRKT